MCGQLVLLTPLKLHAAAEKRDGLQSITNCSFLQPLLVLVRAQNEDVRPRKQTSSHTLVNATFENQIHSQS